jgi:hypothetical protein
MLFNILISLLNKVVKIQGKVHWIKIFCILIWSSHACEWSMVLWDVALCSVVNRYLSAELCVVTSQEPLILANELLHAAQVLNSLPCC